MLQPGTGGQLARVQQKGLGQIQGALIGSEERLYLVAHIVIPIAGGQQERPSIVGRQLQRFMKQLFYSLLDLGHGCNYLLVLIAGQPDMPLKYESW